jgi:two-component system sensor histidine kinase UhpB
MTFFHWKLYTWKDMIDSQMDFTSSTNRVEIALLLSEKRFRDAFEFAAHGMALVGLDGSYLKVNKAFCEIVGYSQEELILANFQSITHPDDLASDLENVRRMLRGEIPSYQVQKRYRHKQGQTVWALLSASMVRDHTGGPLYFVCQIQNISEQKRAEERLARAHAEMEQRVRDRTAELDAAYTTLHRYAQHQQQLKEHERRAFARELHDELGGILTVLKMGLAWLSKNPTAEGIKVEEKIASLSDLTDRSLDVVRKISRDMRIGLLDDVGLVAALDWQVKEFSKQSAIACEWLTNHTAEEFPFSHDLGTALFRICQEALTNVSRHAEATRVTVKLTVGDCIALSIQDNGKGITAEQIANTQSFGLLGMKERLFPYDGTLVITNTEEHGTIIRAIMPLKSVRRRHND